MTQHIKVIHVNCFDKMGGAEQLALDLVTLQNSKLIVKEKFTNNCRAIELSKNLLNKTINVFEKPFRKFGFKRGVKELFCFRDSLNGTIRHLDSIPSYRAANIVHLHNIHGGFFDLKALEILARNKMVVWTLQDMWCMTGGEGYVFNDIGYKSGEAKTPFGSVYPLNDPLIDRRKFYLEKKKEIYKRIGDKIHFVAPSQWLKKCFEASYVYNNNISIKVIHNAVNQRVFYNIGSRNWKKPRGLIFNSLNPYKGSEFVLEALKQIDLSLFDLYTVGIRTGLINEIYQGSFVKQRSKLAELFNNVDFILFPSKAENYSLTLLEASACGVFLIGSDVGGNKEVLNEANGRIFKNVNELVNEIHFVLENLAEVRKLAEKGGKNITSKCNLTTINNQYWDLYNQILNNLPKVVNDDYEIIR